MGLALIREQLGWGLDDIGLEWKWKETGGNATETELTVEKKVMELNII